MTSDLVAQSTVDFDPATHGVMVLYGPNRVARREATVEAAMHVALDGCYVAYLDDSIPAAEAEAFIGRVLAISQHPARCGYRTVVVVDDPDWLSGSSPTADLLLQLVHAVRHGRVSVVVNMANPHCDQASQVGRAVWDSAGIRALFD